MPGPRHTTTSMPINPPSDTWIVLKFGGTSVSRRHRWDTIGRLAKQRADENGARVLVVVSALSGVTNELQAIAEGAHDRVRSEEHTSELQSLMRISYADFCLTKKKKTIKN